jgi:hypothetical protein
MSYCQLANLGGPCILSGQKPFNRAGFRVCGYFTIVFHDGSLFFESFLTCLHFLLSHIARVSRLGSWVSRRAQFDLRAVSLTSRYRNLRSHRLRNIMRLKCDQNTPEKYPLAGRYEKISHCVQIQVKSRPNEVLPQKVACGSSLCLARAEIYTGRVQR